MRFKNADEVVYAFLGHNIDGRDAISGGLVSQDGTLGFHTSTGPSKLLAHFGGAASRVRSTLSDHLYLCTPGPGDTVGTIVAFNRILRILRDVHGLSSEDFPKVKGSERILRCVF